MSKTYDIAQTTAGILAGLDGLAESEPPPARAERAGKRAILARDAVRARIRQMIEAGYQPAQIAQVCEQAGMPVLARTITEFCASDDPAASPARRPARRKRRSRRKSAAAKAATGIATSAESNPDTARPPATEPSVSGTTLPTAQEPTERPSSESTATPSTDPNDELRRTLIRDSEAERARRRRGKFIGED